MPTLAATGRRRPRRQFRVEFRAQLVRVVCDEGATAGAGGATGAGAGGVITLPKGPTGAPTFPRGAPGGWTIERKAPAPPPAAPLTWTTKGGAR